jgi:phenylacetic acid degradation operon negative regulatory protein
MFPSSTRTLLFGIFVLARRKLTASQVITLARPLGISATNVKSHLTRMVAEGALERSGPRRAARYGPSPGQTAVVRAIETRLERDAAEPWNGHWILLALKMPADRGERERLRAALWFDGFRPWDPSTHVRPAWPKAWARARARWYLERAFGLAIEGPLFEPLPVNRLYDLETLDREAGKLARRIRARQAAARSPARAFAARLEIGGLVARLVGHDPRLPRSLWGKRTGMRELARAFTGFEKGISPAARRFLDSV